MTVSVGVIQTGWASFQSAGGGIKLLLFSLYIWKDKPNTPTIHPKQYIYLRSQVATKTGHR